MDILDELTRLSPVPSGGAASAYAANLGVALIYKVLLFELNREVLPPESEANLRVVRKEMKTLLRSLRALREKILSDFQGAPVAVLENTSPYLRNRLLRTSHEISTANQARLICRCRFRHSGERWNPACSMSAGPLLSPG